MREESVLSHLLAEIRGHCADLKPREVAVALQMLFVAVICQGVDGAADDAHLETV